MKRSYLPVLAAPPKLAEKPLFAAAKVRTFAAQAPFDTTQWVVRRANGETVFDFYTSWIAPPQEVLGGELVPFLSGTGLFQAVYPASASVAVRFGIEGQVTKCLLDCSGEKPAASVGVRLLILDEDSPVFTVLASSEQAAQVDVAAEAGEDAAARAFGKAFTQAFAAAAHDLSTAKLPK